MKTQNTRNTQTSIEVRHRFCRTQELLALPTSIELGLVFCQNSEQAPMLPSIQRHSEARGLLRKRKEKQEQKIEMAIEPTISLRTLGGGFLEAIPLPNSL